MFDKLKGYKTYIISAAVIAVAAAYGLGVITKEQFEMAVAFLAGLGGIALRAALK